MPPLTVVFTMLGACLCACSTGVPQPIGQAPGAPISVSEVQLDATRFLGQRVRWGGRIIAVHNRTSDQMTEVELLAQPLTQSGEPVPDAPGDGRFLTEITGPVDPAECRKGRRLTVNGRLLWIEPRPLGQGSYTYPVVVADTWHLWSEPPGPALQASLHGLGEDQDGRPSRLAPAGFGDQLE